MSQSKEITGAQVTQAEIAARLAAPQPVAMIRAAIFSDQSVQVRLSQNPHANAIMLDHLRRKHDNMCNVIFQDRSAEPAPAPSVLVGATGEPIPVDPRKAREASQGVPVPEAE